MLKVLRRGSVRYLLFSVIVVSVLVCLYYANYSTNSSNGTNVSSVVSAGNAPAAILNSASEPPGQAQGQVLEAAAADSKQDVVVKEESSKERDEDSPGDDDVSTEPDGVVSADTCVDIKLAVADVDTAEQFRKFEFQPYWMKSREYWDANFEEKYKARKDKWQDMPLKVIVVPHSHNDPGWLKTFESYYHYQTRNILNNMADKLPALSNMTFMWSEIAFFAQWWESAHPTKRRVVKKLLDEGRLELVTAGWVMTDEATSHIFAMVDQLIEGHQWVKTNLNLSPKSGWSVDPFGHGSTVPYLLKASGFDEQGGGAVIQRIHYAWKQWLAEKQMIDFVWRQNWDPDGRTDMLVHNAPFDIYSIKHSCGPHPQVCLNFDFRKIPGEYTEYSVRAVPIDSRNVRQKAELLLEQYGRTASLSPFNVALISLGDDFRYDRDIEWGQQYSGYSQLMGYINNHTDRYHAEVKFGTVSEYFATIRKRAAILASSAGRTNHSHNFPTLRGDFFVYSDIFSEGRPAYWSGYYTTRPFWKLLDRELESALRSAEILYSMALTTARRVNTGNASLRRLLERDYERLVRARRSLALFQHHDAITGTSKSFVMHDYALKLFEGLQDAGQVTARAATALLGGAADAEKPGLLPDTDRESYEKLPRKVPLVVPRNEPRKVVLFNSLGQQRQEVVSLIVTSAAVRVLDSEGSAIPYQINPVWNITTGNTDGLDGDSMASGTGQEGRYSANGIGMDLKKTGGPFLQMLPDEFELLFVADLPPLSLTTYTIERTAGNNNENRAVIYCAVCRNPPGLVGNNPFEMRGVQTGDVQLENHRLKLLLDGKTGLLRAITRKSTGKITQCGLQFSAYPSAQFHSGAYLFMPDPNSREPEKEVLGEDGGGPPLIVITSGPIASELRTIQRPPTLLDHSARIYHAAGPLSEGVHLQNIVDLGAPPRNRETELFMRLVTDISNGDPPEFYSDLNGFSMQRRVKVERIGIEGNYFPATSAAYIQDSSRRLTLLMNHAQGTSAWQPGWLEVMLDRRTLYDDSRGMGEGVVDNKKTPSHYWLLLEEIKGTSGSAKTYSRPSLLANHLSNGLLYPANLLVAEGGGKLNLGTRLLLNRPLPCDVHLMNLRTMPDPAFSQFPAPSALMVLHRQGYSCDIASTVPRCGLGDSKGGAFKSGTKFKSEAGVKGVQKVSLTGLHSRGDVGELETLKLGPMELATLNITFFL